MQKPNLGHATRDLENVETELGTCNDRMIYAELESPDVLHAKSEMKYTEIRPPGFEPQLSS